jgi:hypothetical protein
MASTKQTVIAPNMQHNLGDRRGMDAATAGKFGRFGRMFPLDVGIEYDPDSLWHLAESMIKADPGQFFNEPDSDENVLIPAAYTYFGQFVDHDLTLDKTSIGARQSDATAMVDFRTPRFDLDSVYGGGPVGDPFLYDKTTFMLLQGETIRPAKPGTVQTAHDHIRGPKDAALIGDPRNDENLIVAQLHTAIIAFHNKVVATPALMAGLSDKWDKFCRAAEITRLHYQWVVLHDFLRKITHPAIFKDVVETGGMPRLRYYPQDGAVFPYMPIEFSGAAYRFGHSMVRPSYALNAGMGVLQSGKKRIPIFDASQNAPDGDLRGFRKAPPGCGIDWGYFLDLPGTAPAKQAGKGLLQPSYRIDTLLVEGLARLPDHGSLAPRQQSLPFLNLLRGSMLRLPSAEQVAAHMGLASGAIGRFALMDPENIWSAGSRMANPKSEPDLKDLRAARAKLRPMFKDAGGQNHTPLWYYILREAEWYSTGLGNDNEGKGGPGKPADIFGGHHLGVMGSTIVLETFLGLMQADASSLLHRPGWRPMTPIAGGKPEGFDLAAMIKWALT